MNDVLFAGHKQNRQHALSIVIAYTMQQTQLGKKTQIN